MGLRFAAIVGFIPVVCAADEPAAKPQSEAEKVVRPLDDDHAELGVVIAATPGSGVLVIEVAPHSPADISGLEPGDFLLEIEGKKISNPEELRKVIQAKKAGTHVEFSIWRRGESLKREVTLAAKSSDPAEKQPWLGVVLQSSDEPGALIELVHPRSPAKLAGLRHGDLVVQIDGEKISSVKDAIAQIEKREPLATVTIVVRREGKEEALKVTLGRASEALNSMPRLLDEGLEGLLPEEWERIRDNAQVKELVHRLQQEITEMRQEMRRRFGKDGEEKRNGKDEPAKPANPEGRKPAKPDSKESTEGASVTGKSVPESITATDDYLAQYRAYYPGRPYRYGYPPPRPYRYSYYYYRGVPYYYAYPPPYPYQYPAPYYGPGVTVRVGPGVYYRN